VTRPNLRLSVVIPAYNEEENLKKGVLIPVWNYLRKQNYNWEVIIVDDSSTDKTVLLLEKFINDRHGFRLLKEPHRGKGGTVIAGMLAAKSDVVLFTDMDQATPITEIGKLLPKFPNYDIVIGIRSGRKGAPLSRKIMAYGFSALRRIILGLPYKDTQCGFKAFKKEAASQIFKKMKVFNDKKLKSKGSSVTAGFDLEILYLAKKLKLKVAEVEVVWIHKETKRVSPLKDSFEGLRDLLKVRINAILGKYRV
jgi:glycosyltransferase involved in cell wall biosynthesis